ncbi:hypothetical protein QBC42DRAFT_62290 [Cladorrhinum samala]|uniref:Secreted protein n=1 Tax=Cladorrhinum samala TaxID=585594 RepID=A0AAV9I127_9PEZI|nr:hypothetical protein QBC42DRAFT_62290 [Cladorrhinum samala]
MNIRGVPTGGFFFFFFFSHLINLTRSPLDPKRKEGRKERKKEKDISKSALGLFFWVEFSFYSRRLFTITGRLLGQKGKNENRRG